MMILSVISAALLFGYLVTMAKRKGVPDMVSDTFYQLGKGKGWVFSAVLTASALMMMVCLLDSGRGLACAAFVGTVGVMFVGGAPNYLSQDEYLVHKTAAVVAAVGCTLWCLSVNIWPTIILAAIYAAYLAMREVAKAAEGVWWIAPAAKGWHPWYWAETAAFADIFLTYWVCNLR